MEDIVCQMVSQRVQSPHGVIDGMRKPCERMPVGCIEIKKSPFLKSYIKGMNIRIIDNIGRIIPVHKLVVKRFYIYQECYQ